MDKVYSSVLHNRPLVALYEKNLEGFVSDDVPRNRSALCGSTDMGNVTHLVPSIHPHFYIGGVEVNHTRGFTDDAGINIFLFYFQKLTFSLVITKTCLYNSEPLKPHLFIYTEPKKKLSQSRY